VDPIRWPTVNVNPDAPAHPGRPRRIALLTENLGNGYSEPIFAEVIGVAREHGIEVICFVQGLTEVPPLRNMVSDLAGKQCVDGILVLSLGSTVSVDDLVAYCQRYHPLPVCSTTVPWIQYPNVLVDNEPGMRDGIRHLIETHDRRRIAFVRGPETSAEAELRFRVYRDVLAEHRLALDPRLVCPPGWFIIQDGINAVRLLVDERGVSFDAVACVNDAAAMGVIQELSGRGILVPDQVAVLGFDDIDIISPYLESPLTTVRQPLREQAREAFLVLLSQMTGKLSPTRTVLQAKLVIRESCGCSVYLQDSAVTTTGPGSMTLEELSNKEEVVAAMIAVHAPRLSSAPRAQELYAAFIADLSGSGDSFMRQLDALLRVATRSSRDVGNFQRLVTVLEREAADLLDQECDAYARADALLHGARVHISNVSERTPAMQQLHFEAICHNLSLMNRALMAAHDIASLTAALAEHLPAFGISRCYVCLFDDDLVPAEWARLILAWDAGRELALPPEGVRFRPQQLLPDGILPNDQVCAYAAYLLDRAGRSPGYVVWEKGAPEGVVYQALQQQVGAAIGRLRLLDRLVEEARRREIAERERLENEVRVARRIQTGIAPRDLRVNGLDLAAKQVPATEVGGDYHDIIPVRGGAWIGMGRVTGHGLPTGLVMLMLQSVVSGLARSGADADPSEILRVVHAVLFENTRQRMANEERVGMTLLRYRSDGRLVFAGTDAGMVICRAGGGRTESASTTEATVEDSKSESRDTFCELREGDLVVLYSLGVVDARNGQDQAFGSERIAALVEQVRQEPVQSICDALIARVAGWQTVQQDDITVLVARQVGTNAEHRP
jgi:phosphoserine phosphatase RsbU/P